MKNRIEDFKDVFGRWRRSIKIQGYQHFTRSGSRWNNMILRCKAGSIAQLKFPNYVGCTTSVNFKDFNYFAGWHTQQAGYGLEGYHLDKDILVSGNTQYNELNCVLVPETLNAFFVSSLRRNGKMMKGVTYQAECTKCPYRVQFSIAGKHINLGGYSTELGAHLAYRAAKEAESYRWYERLKAGEFIVDPRVIERMRTWKLEAE